MSALTSITLLAAEAAADVSLPAWAERVSVVGLIVFFGLALARGWLMTSGQAERLLDSERRVSELYRQAAETSQANADRMVTAIEPVTAGNAAILRAVEEIQREQMAQRYRGRGIDSDQGGR